MKNIYLYSTITLCVLILAGLWFYISKARFIFFSDFLIIALLLLFGVYFVYRRLTGIKRGEPVEDELSKKIMRQASSLAYFISLYLWVAVLYMKDKIPMDADTALGAGIIGMAVIFAVCWVFVYFKGVNGE